MHKLYISYCMFALIVCYGCSVLSKQQQAPPAVAQNAAMPQSSIDPPERRDPTCCGSFTSEELKSAWNLLTEDGRYRLPRREDMRFSDERLKSRLPYEYHWSDLGFDGDPTRDLLAAIVVDTQRNDQNRFGLVIFSSPNHQNGKYKTYWLYRERDLSRTVIQRESNRLSIIEYGGDGSRKGCYVRWNSQQQKYLCN